MSEAKKYIAVDSNNETKDAIHMTSTENEVCGTLKIVNGETTKDVKDVFIAKIKVNGVEVVPTVDSETGTLVVDIRTSEPPEPPEPTNPTVYMKAFTFEDMLASDDIESLNSDQISNDFISNVGLPEQFEVDNVTQVILFAPSQYVLKRAETEDNLQFPVETIGQKTIKNMPYLGWMIQTTASFSDTIGFTWKNQSN